MRWLTILALIIAPPSLAENDALKNQLLAPLVPAELLNYSDFQIPGRENVEVISDGTRDFVELRMLPGQNLTNGGDRAEISVDNPFLEGDTVSYQWQMRLPSDSQADPQSRWWILAQWHDQPDRRIGETWAEFTSRSPPIAMIYGTIEGQESIALYYGVPDPESLAFAPIFRDVWYDFRFDIHWSTKDDGWVKVYVDGSSEPLMQATGANMYNSYQHFFKFGMYRHPAIQRLSRIQLDNLRISHVE